MTYLVDSNVLLRWTQPAAPEYLTAVAVIDDTLRLRGENLVVAPQNLVEIWSVATRPEAVNGLGLTPATAEILVSGIESLFLLAPDDPRIYPEWRRLVVTHAVQGRQVHDARLVAVMRVHGITNILTFNGADFRRYPGITAVHPGAV